MGKEKTAPPSEAVHTTGMISGYPLDEVNTIEAGPRTIMFWVDDLRNPKDFFSEEELTMYSEVHWVRDYEQFEFYLEYHEFPDIIFFDHDLGEGKNGYDCVKHLVAYCSRRNIKLPIVRCHSENPVGKKNILSYVESYEKSLFQNDNSDRF